ncbi:MBL fold metallo-hydrolase [Lentzea sp. JNUCC 0626]|uniref:MBL fold metallo-hydrolase n=1 Tax=Lentzea sp. JNUCC 0626 TaxID=3367513 RepID=UPI003747931D
MELEVVGCATPFPGRDRPCSGYVLSEGDRRVLLDCGSGVVGHLNPGELSCVWISHLHPDHFGDLPALANWALNTPGAVRLPVFGPRGWDRRLNVFLTGDPDSGTASDVFEVGYVSDGARIDLGDLRLESRAVHHSVEAYGVRVTGADRSFAYSGDTGPCAALVDLALDADLFLCEAGSTTPSEHHLTMRQAYEIAVAARAGELLLTHVQETSTAIVEPSELPTSLARPGEVRPIGPRTAS